MQKNRTMNNTIINSTSHELYAAFDSVSRLHFYERVEMVTNTFDHKHPPYREGFHAHPLRIMSANEKVSDKLYQQFAEDLNKVVM